MLDLSKGQSLDLKKADGTAISKIRVGLSWDAEPQNGRDVDVDLFIHDKVRKATAYFWAKNAIKGVTLGDDNLTGAGDGDDEFALLDATQSEDGDYVIAINIYEASSRNQKLSGVKNAKATVYNAETNEVLATYSIQENGGENTGIIVWVVTDSGNAYKFTAKGDFVTGDINTIVASL